VLDPALSIHETREMHHDEFKAAFLDALREAELRAVPPFPSQELLDLRSTDRLVTIYIASGSDIGKPFHIGGEVSWRWDALQVARTATTEEDLLAELFGTHSAGKLKTDRPGLRVDLKLHASLPYDKAIPMPSSAKWAKWSREAIGRLEKVERLVSEKTTKRTPEGRHAILAWQGDPKLKVTCAASGELRLDSITAHGFQIIELPRIWDDPDRKADPHPGKQLSAMFKRMRAALFAWGEVMDHLT
jgi:hypothetical protein